MDAKTGGPVSRSGSTTRVPGACAVRGRRFIAARDGVVSVIKPGRTFELLAENRLANGEEITASPITADGRLYIRGFKNLYAFGNK